jgi:streptogramin lyase
MKVRLLVVACALALCWSCASRSQSGAFVPQATSALQTGDLTVRITLPSEKQRRSHYVSPSSKGMTVHVTGLSSFNKTVGIALGANGCISTLMTRTCELKIPKLHACPSKKNCYSATVIVYDAFANGAIPPGAHELSALENFGFHVNVNGTALIPIVLQGLPASVAFAPRASSSLEGTQTSGFVLPKCGVTQQRVGVYGLDADRNIILGNGSPAVTLTSSNPAQLAAAAVSPQSPNTFTLTPPAAPAFAFGGATIALTATATPKASSGGSAVHATIDVSYSGDICGVVDEFTTPTSGSGPLLIASGPDGAVWFTEISAGKIGRIPVTATNGSSIQEFSVPTAGSNPFGITAGPDGNVWFTELVGNNIGRIPVSATSGSQITEIPTRGNPTYIVAGPDGNLWYTEYSSGMIARIPTTATHTVPGITEFTLTSPSSDPSGIAVGPDGKMWFTEYNSDNIGSIAVTGGAITEFTVTGSPVDLSTGSDGALWFTAQTADAIGRIFTSGTAISTYSLPSTADGLQGIATGPDGALWFDEQLTGRIGRITLDGTITEFTLSASSEPTGIAAGPDGAIWFTERSANKVGRIR